MDRLKEFVIREGVVYTSDKVFGRDKYSVSGLRNIKTLGFVGVLALCVSALSATAQERLQPVNSYGVPGLIDMPNAYMQPDAELTTNLAYFIDTARLSMAFQVTPRLQGVFRYAGIEDYNGAGTGRNFDRSFDLRYQLLTETAQRPAVTVGLQDFGGTGIYAGEYLVASKTFQDRLTLTGGIGWGRFGSHGSFRNPLGRLDGRFDTRPAGFIGTGGQFGANQWFRGPAALFGGASYQHSERLRFNVEYSSDSYAFERARGTIRHETPINLGFSYDWRPGVMLSGYTLLGDTVGLNLTFNLNPRRAPIGIAGLDKAPPPVQPRPDRAANPELWNTEWIDDPTSAPILEQNMIDLLDEMGLVLESYRLGATEVEVRFRNRSYRSTAQAIGRAARGLSYALPASVEYFVLVPLDDATGLPGAMVRISRSDLEDLEGQPDAAWTSYVRAEISDAGGQDTAGLTVAPGVYPAWNWALEPYVSTALFDPSAPLRLDLGIEASGRFEPAPGLVFSGALRYKVVGNRGRLDLSPSALTRVRTDAPLYLQAQDNGAFIPQLMGEYFFRPGENLYARLSAGYLETMYGGVSAELLWRPANSPLSLGLEVNQVRQRDFDQRFGLRAYEVTTGHLSAYYEHDTGFYSQLDVGQYLAGDRGFTYTLMREFQNGWRIGGYFTQTNVSAAQFGEGSFDKGIRLSVPLDWFTGRSNRSDRRLLIQPIQRDGGARLAGPTRLYDRTRPQTQPALGDDWARMWR